MSAPTTDRVVTDAGTDVLTVASVPGSHVYVRHLAAEPPGAVTRLPDPHPSDPGRSTVEAWWPPVMLQPDWIRTHTFDLFHVQFGFDAWAPDELERVAGTLRDEGRPLVYTVHDLRNPHHLDRALHDEQLDVLVPAADALITLTDGAAAEIDRRWGRDALVLPHPHVVDFATMARLRRSGQEPGARPEHRVGLHVKSLRAGMEPLRLLPDLIRAVGELPGGVLQVNGHRDVLDPSGRRYDARLATALRRAEHRGQLELHVHDFLTDAALWTYLATLDVSVLPYRFGTHSGWLEACRDLGTTVVAPSCGYFADQAPVLTYLHDEDRYDGDSLVAAILQSPRQAALGATGIAERREQRDLLAAAHEDLYRSLLR